MPLAKNLVFASQVSDEIGEFLRPRLRDACLALVTVWLLCLLMQLPFPSLAPSRASNVALGLAVVLCLPMLALLWRRAWPLAPGQLRLIEFGLFAVSSAVLIVVQFAWIDRVRGGELEHAAVAAFFADSLALPWFMQIVVYGTYIPNAWQRTLLAASAMAALPLALTAAALPGVEAVRAEVLPEMSLVLLAAVAIAVYGSIRTSVLRREALDARQLGQYRLKTKLGQGGMGEVYLAEHQLLRRPCAVKVIRADTNRDERLLARFEREVQATCTLMHANIVRIYDYGITQDRTLYYVMEYLAGLDLQQLVERHGPLPAERAVYLLRQVCSALHEAHARGLIHRDIKPSNIMICEQGLQYDVAKLTDFGLVRAPQEEADSRLTTAGALVGTPFFMSPEQLSGLDVDGRSDIYSLGVVAYFLLAGSNPFARATRREVMTAHLSESAPPLIDQCPGVDVDLHAVVMRCLEKDPNERFHDVKRLETALGKCGCAEHWTQERAEAWWHAHPL